MQAPGLPAGTLLMDIGFENMFINDAGLMIFESTYGDGTTTTGEGLFSVVVPEPATATLLGAGALALLARRRRA